MFKKNRFMVQSNVVKQNQVLMDLPHITNMGHDRDAKLARHHADSDIFADAADPCAIHLHKMNCTRLQEILEEHTPR